MRNWYCFRFLKAILYLRKFNLYYFLDLSKAFDSVNHKKLLRRLENIGFDELATNLIENCLSERTQRMILIGIESDWINLQRGVRQGTILGLLLFNIYVNDLAKIVEKGCTVCRRHFSFYIRHR